MKHLVSYGSGMVRFLVQDGSTWKWEDCDQPYIGYAFDSREAAVAALTKIGMEPADNTIFGPHILSVEDDVLNSLNRDI